MWLSEGPAILYYRFSPEDGSAQTMRVKLEINTREHFNHLGTFSCFEDDSGNPPQKTKKFFPNSIFHVVWHGVGTPLVTHGKPTAFSSIFKFPERNILRQLIIKRKNLLKGFTCKDLTIPGEPISDLPILRQLIIKRKNLLRGFTFKDLTIPVDRISHFQILRQLIIKRKNLLKGFTCKDLIIPVERISDLPILRQRIIKRKSLLRGFTCKDRMTQVEPSDLQILRQRIYGF